MAEGVGNVLFSLSRCASLELPDVFCFPGFFFFCFLFAMKFHFDCGTMFIDRVDLHIFWGNFLFARDGGFFFIWRATLPDCGRIFCVEQQPQL